MTTQVTVTASGTCFPARVVKWDASSGKPVAVEDTMIAGGFSYMSWVGSG